MCKEKRDDNKWIGATEEQFSKNVGVLSCVISILMVPCVSAVSGKSRYKPQSSGEMRTPLCRTPLNHFRKLWTENCWSHLSSGAENMTYS